MELFRGWIRKADNTYGAISPMTLTQMLSQETALGLVSVGVTDLEQSTGLEDKNGTMIFDGDIVELNSNRYLVVINHGTNWLVDDSLAMGRKMLLDNHVVVVVGNSHENKF